MMKMNLFKKLKKWLELPLIIERYNLEAERRLNNLKFHLSDLVDSHKELQAISYRLSEIEKEIKKK